MRGGNRQFCSSLRDIAQLSAICNVRYEPIGSASTTDSRRALNEIIKSFFIRYRRKIIWANFIN